LRQIDGPRSGLPEHDEAVLDARQRLGISALLGLAEPVHVAPAPAPPPVRPDRRAQLAASAPLVAILAVQAVLTLRNIWTNTAFQDEALYLWAGHLEISHWLHGTPVPPFATYFSGAPVLYPPIGALADSIGGLAAARILSLAFMLGATSLLWCTSARLHGRRAAFFAAALFALLGLTLHVGAFATFDALAMLLLALSAWCVVRASDRLDDGTGWILVGAVALMLANAAAYSSAIFDPVVVVLAVLVSAGRSDRKVATRRGAALFAYTSSLIIVAVTIGGGFYSAGIAQTVLARAFGSDSPGTVLLTAGRWVAVLAALAGLGAVLSLLRRRDGWRRVLPLVLFGALLLVPVQQARIHTLVSLDKHVDIGAWFAAIAAGYAIDRVVTWMQPRVVRVAVTAASACTLAIVAQTAQAQASSLSLWPNGAELVTTFAPLAAQGGRLLVEDPSIAEYYLPAGRRWWQWSSTRSIVLSTTHSVDVPADADEAAATYARYIARGYFSVVALNFADTADLDRKIAADLGRNHSYRIAETIPYGAADYVVWQRMTASADR
jgi:4-amino-4-deoxy-L-arabinose transferase-like glycosyltransferase